MLHCVVFYPRHEGCAEPISQPAADNDRFQIEQVLSVYERDAQTPHSVVDQPHSHRITLGQCLLYDAAGHPVATPLAHDWLYARMRPPSQSRRSTQQAITSHPLLRPVLTQGVTQPARWHGCSMNSASMASPSNLRSCWAVGGGRAHKHTFAL